MATDDSSSDGDRDREHDRNREHGHPRDQNNGHTRDRDHDRTRLPESTLSERELEAVHEVELGLEWAQRAQGSLIEFHHATGHGMDHLDEAETLLREAGHDELATAIRRDLLPHGVVDGDRWSYDVLEDFQESLLSEAVALERRVRNELTDGERHVCERRQERAWKYEADEER